MPGGVIMPTAEPCCLGRIVKLLVHSPNREKLTFTKGKKKKPKNEDNDF